MVCARGPLGKSLAELITSLTSDTVSPSDLALPMNLSVYLRQGRLQTESERRPHAFLDARSCPA